MGFDTTRNALYLGVDGGGTGCRARLEDAAGRRLGEGTGGPANIRFGVEAAWAAVLTACRKALGQAGLPPEALGRVRAGIGLAGLQQRETRDRFLAEPHPFAALTLVSDAHAACLGAHDGGDGGIIIVGTGSAGFALVDGRPVEVGGWGFDLSDHASGAALGRAALRRALWAHEAVIPATPFTRAVMERHGNDPHAMLTWTETARPRSYAALAPLVFEHARAGDAEARPLVVEAARELGQLIDALAARGVRRLCLLGGLAGVYPDWLDEARRARLVQPLKDARSGALMLARGTASC